ncbi:MAG: PIG-L family deacetylase [Bacteroidia bacterium]
MNYPIHCLIALLFLNISKSSAQPGEILQKMHQFGTVANVLYIAAHPDDENTRLISYLVNSRHYRTAYLSMTRGDGGQNLIGNEQTEELGLIRTQELLAARRQDGGEQFFTKAYDFGYSKNPEETFNIWNKKEILKPIVYTNQGIKDVSSNKEDKYSDNIILSDVVWVIRNFRPDIIVTRFPTTGEGGHGHHTASAILAVEAFKAAADPNAYPSQLAYVEPWQTKRIFWNNFMRWRDPNADMSATMPLEINEFIPELGESVGEIAAYSRSSHRSQGFGSKPQYGELMEYFSQLDGDKAENDIMEGIPSTWARIPSGKAIENGIKKAILEFKIDNAAASIPLLIKLNEELIKIPDFPGKKYKQAQLAEIILLCAGIHQEFNADQSEVSPGDSLKTELSITSRAPVGTILIKGVFIKGAKELNQNRTDTLVQGVTLEQKYVIAIPENAEFTNPYWLSEPHLEGRFEVKKYDQVGQADVDDAFKVIIKYSINGSEFLSEIPLEYRWVDPSRGELIKPCIIVPQVSAQVFPDLAVLSGNDEKLIRVELQGKNLKGTTYSLDVPSSIFTVEPASITITEDKPLHSLNFKVSVSKNRMIKPDSTWNVSLKMNKNGNSSTVKTVTKIDYDHIPEQTWIKDATVKLVNLNLVKVGNSIAYLEGAGDKVDDCLTNAGYDVHMLQENEIRVDNLKQYQAVVIGIRAFNTREDMSIVMPVLLEYVKQGGNLIVQYNTKNWISDVQVVPGPYPLTVSRDRITEEDAELKILKPDHPLMNYPNKINKNDFEGWVQERGLYFPDKWAAEYTPLLAGSDSGEEEMQGILLAAEYGKGHFVYTGLSFFRELPAGVPGAYRLIANMISWGNEQE